MHINALIILIQFKEYRIISLLRPDMKTLIIISFNIEAIANNLNLLIISIASLI